MRILFMGTPDFAEESLAALYKTGEEIIGVFTQPDKPKNRGMKLSMSPVKITAMNHNTPVYQPETLKDSQTIDLIRELSPDLICVVAYGRLLPREILEIPKYGCINIHGSLLPKYRGAAPIQWSVLNGDKVTGVTAIFLEEGMDNGDIIASNTIQIGENETAGELFVRLAKTGADLLTKTVNSIAQGTVSRTPQKESEATYAPPLKKDQAPIDWNKSAFEIVNQVRGLNPWPVATAIIDSVDLKIFRAILSNSHGVPGSVIAADKNGIEIACGDKSIIITELQAPGKKRMKAADYLRGHPINV